MNPILLLLVNYEGSFLIYAYLEMTIHHISISLIHWGLTQVFSRRHQPKS